jgi:hypothetical protein
MAFTKTPAQSTYQTEQIKLLHSMDSRDGLATKDLDYLNCFVDIVQNKAAKDNDYHVVKRDGLTAYGPTLQSANVRGLHYWEDQNKIFVAVDDDIQVINATTGATITTLTTFFGTSSGTVGFAEFLYDDNTVKIVATDGTTLKTIDSSNTVVAGADADMPVPHLPYPIFLDGYLFLAKSNTADIYNSDLNDPLAYTSGNFLASEMFPDTINRIAKLNNYLVAFGTYSIEYFWDAANESGSPLQRNDTPVKLTGFMGGFAQHGNKIYFVGNTSTGTPEVYVLEDFKFNAVSTPTIRRYLASLSASTVSIIGNIISHNGRDFYVLNVGSLTYCMDLETQLWTRLAYQGNANFTCEHAIAVKDDTTQLCVVYLNSLTTLLKFSPSVYQDNSSNFTVRIVTDTQMFDSYNRKTMSKFIVYADRPTSSANLLVYYTDDDYQTYSTARTIDLNQEYPSLTRLGTFRRRAFKLEFASNHPLRIHYLEVKLNLGTA